MKKKKYLKLDGYIYNSQGWSELQQSAILDAITAITEMAGEKAQAAVSVKRMTEKEVLDEEE